MVEPTSPGLGISNDFNAAFPQHISTLDGSRIGENGLFRITVRISPSLIRAGEYFTGGTENVARWERD